MSLADLVNVSVVTNLRHMVLEWETHRPVFVPEVEEALALLRSIDVSRFPMPLRVEPFTAWVRGRDSVHIELWIHAMVSDRESGQVIRLKFTASESFAIGPGLIEMVQRWVHGELRAAVVHELDECFLVGGKRVADPHAYERPPAAPIPWGPPPVVRRP
jgi:hypothetical protein